MTARYANFPSLVLEDARALAAHLGVARATVLAAACRAVLAHPPPNLVAYPTLDTAIANVGVPLPLDVGEAVLDAARRYFYGRLPWLVMWGLRHRRDAVVVLGKMGRQNVASIDAALVVRYNDTIGGHPCPTPPTARAPRTARRRAS